VGFGSQRSPGSSARALDANRGGHRRAIVNLKAGKAWMGWDISTPATGVATTAAGAVLGWLGRGLWRWLRLGSSREWEEVRELRKALDRLRRRENAYATGFEIVLIVMPPALKPEHRLAVDRAIHLFETATVHVHGCGEA
jgi:hypothetical protein